MAESIDRAQSADHAQTALDAPARAAGPIHLQGSLHETIWGGQNLATIAGKTLAAGATVGESWETAVESVAINPPYTGKTLGALVDELGEALLGRRSIEVFGRRFPLLAKFIDAQQWLSVQVHPDDHYAATHENGKLGKTETWYILRAEPGAQIIYGLSRESNQDEVRAAIAENRLEALTQRLDVRAGDVIFVPAGTVHAIGAGVALYELQEYSDVTYRLYDYGRLQADGKPRELHVAKSLDVMRYGRSPLERVTPVQAPFDGSDGTRRTLVACRYFVEEELRFIGEARGATDGSSLHILSTLGGAYTLQTGAGALTLRLGETVVIPADAGAYTLRALDEQGAAREARVLRSYVPTEGDASLLAWRAAQPVPIE